MNNELANCVAFAMGNFIEIPEQYATQGRRRLNNMVDVQDRDLLNKSPVGELIILLDGEPNQYNCISYKELQLMTKNNCPHIVTPLTTAIDTFYTYRGYRVIVKSEDKEYCLNDMLLGDTKPNEKELRTAHNAEKLFLSGCYDIKVNWDI